MQNQRDATESFFQKQENLPVRPGPSRLFGVCDIFQNIMIRWCNSAERFNSQASKACPKGCVLIARCRGDLWLLAGER